jgi:hypothetical protein
MILERSNALHILKQFPSSVTLQTTRFGTGFPSRFSLIYIKKLISSPRTVLFQLMIEAEPAPKNCVFLKLTDQGKMSKNMQMYNDTLS